MPAVEANQIISDRLLVHEGKADIHILRALRGVRSIEGYQSFNLKGQRNRGGYFKGLALSPHFRTPVPGHAGPVRALAIVLDAEADAERTFTGVRDALLNAGLPAPDAPGDITDGPLRVGVFLVPDNHSPGMIETLCLQSVAADPAWACLDGYFQCFVDHGGILPVNMDKARAQAFLATRPEPDLPVGLAAEEGYWNLGHPAFTPLAEFLQRMAAP